MRDTLAQRFDVLQSLVARRPHMALEVLAESTVYCFELLRHVFVAVEFSGFSESQQVAEPFGALDAPFCRRRHYDRQPRSATSFYLVVVRVDMEILQEATQHLSVVVPEDYSLADLASFPSQIPTFVPFDSVLFRKRHHDLVDTVYNEVQYSRWCCKMRSSCCLRPFCFFLVIEFA